MEALFAAHAMDRGETVLTLAEAQVVAQRSANRYDRDGDSHYDILSAFQKSVRGSDPDAAVHYLARLLEAGDLISPCRRLMVMASEDVGLAYPQAVAVVKACVDSANMLGLPEARIPLAQAAIFLATAPKSNSAILAVEGRWQTCGRDGRGRCRRISGTPTMRGRPSWAMGRGTSMPMGIPTTM